MHTREEKLEAFGRLIDVLDELREKCPWDRKQTFDSLRPNTIEEVYELCDASINHDWKNVCKELGDVLEHVIFYAIMGSEMGEFDIADICNKEADKLIFRHPHIYGNLQLDDLQSDNLTIGQSGNLKEVKTSDDVMDNWEQIKMKEKDGNRTVLSGVPQALPSLIKAFRVTEKASSVGFDWEKKEDVWAKVREEIDELEAELAKGDKEKSTDEMGDFIFSLVNAARLYKINPDTALERTNQKFIRRFGYVEQQTLKQGRQLKDMTLGELDALWDEAKKESHP